MIAEYLLALLGFLMAGVGGLFIAAVFKAVDAEERRVAGR